MKTKPKKIIAKKRIKRVILGEGYHWFYNASEVQSSAQVGYALVGLHDSNGKLINFVGELPQCRKGRLVLEIEK